MSSKKSPSYLCCFSRDTVGSVAFQLPFTKSDYAVRNFRHALALDEHRTKFKANLWVQPSDFNIRVNHNEGANGQSSPPPIPHQQNHNFLVAFSGLKALFRLPRKPTSPNRIKAPKKNVRTLAVLSHSTLL